MANGIVVESTIPDLANLGGMVTDAERKVLTRYRGRILQFVKGAWTGWRYEGRPASAPRNVSMQAWRGRVVVNVAPPELLIENEARSWNNGADYVAYVRRRKGEEEEWRKIGRRLETEWSLHLAADLLREVQRTIQTPTTRRPLRTRALTPNTAVVATALEL